MKTKPIADEYFPDTAVSFHVSITKDNLRSIRDNYDAMLTFISRMTGMEKSKISIHELKYYDMKAYHDAKNFSENLCWPIHKYLARIRYLESKLSEVDKE